MQGSNGWKITERDERDYVKHKGKKSIYCFTCQKNIVSKSHLRPTHQGHEVEYIDA